MDARPSDAIAIALKFSALIYVNSYIMDEVGFVPDYEEQVLPKEEGENEDILSAFDTEQNFTKPSETTKKSSSNEKKIISQRGT